MDEVTLAIIKTGINKIASDLEKRTANWEKSHMPKALPKDSKAGRIQKALSESTTLTMYQKRDVARMLSEILEEPILIGTKTVRFHKGIVMVPLGNDNHHDYEEGQPILCVTPSDIDNYNRFIRKNGTTGNNLTGTPSLLRVATHDEIRELVEGLVNKVPDFLSDLMDELEEE